MSKNYRVRYYEPVKSIWKLLINQNGIDLVTDMFIGCIADKYGIRENASNKGGFIDRHDKFWYYTISDTNGDRNPNNTLDDKSFFIMLLTRLIWIIIVIG